MAVERASPAPIRPVAVPATPALSRAEPPLARAFTSKQTGDACEMLVAAELALAGIPALKFPDNWPHKDVIAQPLGRPAQRISVKVSSERIGER